MPSRWLLASAQRKAMMAPSWSGAFPACLRRWPTMLVQPAPATPERFFRGLQPGIAAAQRPGGCRSQPRDLGGPFFRERPQEPPFFS
jgi:hypothetical protein